VFTPGTALGYSNASSIVAGYAATCVMAQSWEALLTERILRPLGLSQSALFAEDLLGHPVALGYVRRNPSEPVQRVPRWALPRSLGPAGATLCCSAGDLVRFACMFLQDGESLAGNRVLSESSVGIMHTPRIDLLTRLVAQRWCVGPYWKQWGGHTIYGHSGVNSGGSSEVVWCPQKRVAIATTVNVADHGYALAEHIFDRVFPQLFGIPKPKAPDAEALTLHEIGDLASFPGRYEALGILVHVELRRDKLVARTDSDVVRSLGLAPIPESELIPLGDGRFLPRNPAFSGHRGWDVAFWDETGAGRPTHLLNGMFALRRTG
jgi:CubicO group peptidase (beta-lactamase class C family)